MKRISFLLLYSLLFLGSFIQAQTKTYGILIKGGHVIDAKNNINEKMDVAIKDGKIAAIAKNIDPALASSVFVTTITDVIGFLSFLGLGSYYFLN
mgnify:CR=1 FL=1